MGKCIACIFVSVFLIPSFLILAAESTFSSEKSKWYIGFGIGTGDVLSIDENDSFKGYDFVSGRLKIAPTYNFGVGYILTKNINIGYDMSGILRVGNKGGYDQEAFISNYFIAGSYYPFERGLSVKIGAGLSRMYYNKGISGSGESNKVEISRTYKGMGILAGVGYEFMPDSAWAFGIHAEYTRQYYLSPSSPSTSDFWNIYVSSYWY